MFIEITLFLISLFLSLPFILTLTVITWGALEELFYELRKEKIINKCIKRLPNTKEVQYLEDKERFIYLVTKCLLVESNDFFTLREICYLIDPYFGNCLSDQWAARRMCEICEDYDNYHIHRSTNRDRVTIFCKT